MSKTQKRVKRDRLIEEYKDFVEHVAAKLSSSLNLPKKHYEDHVASGYMGLVEAAERYDESVGTDFKQYAFLRIRGAIIDGIRRHSDLSTRAYHFTKALKATQELREEELKQELATDTESRLSQILDYAAKGALAFRYSLEEARDELLEMHADEDTPEEVYLRKKKAEALSKALEILDDRERIIIHDYYLKGKSFVQISEEQEGLSKSWISRLHVRALQKLQQHFMEVESEVYTSGA